MTLGIILAIIFIGLVLVFLEIFLIPGTTLFGIGGGIALIIGVLMIYSYYGMFYGNIAASSTAGLVGVAVVAGFKVIQSNKLAMKAEITGKVNELERHLYEVGEKGLTVSELRPNGKAIFKGEKVDVYSTGEYIARNTEIEITKITHDKIFIKPVKS